jgi:hypothetical protein
MDSALGNKLAEILGGTTHLSRLRHSVYQQVIRSSMG